MLLSTLIQMALPASMRTNRAVYDGDMTIELVNAESVCIRLPGLNQE